ncbi:MAG: hypothetical protein KGH93_00905 [Patescibacteria group bacterium]|nr:hypothetical protein [Patescibacteria group bacterium]MDE1945739.1 hypothetical protein [Patescibacteria group bacterium]
MIDSKYLPSRKFVTALGIAAFLILAAWGISLIKPGTPHAKIVTINNPASSIQVDTDTDGLPDWEEALYGTDPHNPDTAGDGMTDGEKIQESRDPTLPNTAAIGMAPTNLFSTTTVAESNAIAAANDNLNATEKLAHDLFSNIIAAQPVGGSLDQNTVNMLADQAIGNLPQKNFIGTTTMTGLHFIPIDQANIHAQITAYRSAFYLATDGIKALLGQDAAAFNANSASGDMSGAQTAVLKIIASYQAIAQTLIRMPLPAIPESLGAETHLAIVNDLQGLAALDRDILASNKNNDSASIYADLQNYIGLTSNLVASLYLMDTNLGIARSNN